MSNRCIRIIDTFASYAVVISAVLALIAAFIPEKTALAQTAAAITVASAVIEVWTKILLNQQSGKEIARLEATLRAIEPFAWSPDSLTRLSKTIKTMKSDIHIVARLPGDTIHASRQLVKVFRDAGWNVEEGSQLTAPQYSDCRLIVSGKDIGVRDFVCDALTEADIEHSVDNGGEPLKSVDLIVVERYRVS